MAGLTRTFQNYLLFMVICLLAVILASSIGILIAVVFNNHRRSSTFSFVAFMAMNLLGGFYLDSNNLGSWISWTRYLSFVKYGTVKIASNALLVLKSIHLRPTYL